MKTKATVHRSSGAVGLKGTHHSKYWRYFFATVISRTAEGYAQATVQRDQTLLAGPIARPNPENAGKVAVAEAAAGTADQFSKKLQNAPEYATQKGPIRTKIFVIETPKLTN